MKPDLMIPFNIPYIAGQEHEFVLKAIENRHLSGGNYFALECEKWLTNYTSSKKVLLTSSCTQALEFAALLCDFQAGDEVIMPSFTFVSSANAFVLRGAKIVFVDIDPISMNIDADLIEDAISPKTKAILAMHYGGVACDMDKILKIARKYNLFIIEDAAHCIGAYDKNGAHLGSIGDLGVISFHATKNVQCGEGGALLINNAKFIERADTIRDKGTDRLDFLNGKVSNYTWVSIGSNYWLNELAAAFLWAQLLQTEHINSLRKQIWLNYYEALSDEFGLDTNPNPLLHNAHIFYLKCCDQVQRYELMKFLKDKGIQTATHYEPLHLSNFGKTVGSFHGEDHHTSFESKRILKLPLYPELKIEDVAMVGESIVEFNNSHILCN